MGNTVGDLYVRPKKEGDNPYTRSGLPPPKLVKKSGSDEPTHRLHDPMSLELHMADERIRTRGLSEAERQWRAKYIADQHLHPDEPVHVDAVHRQLNPVRVVYRWPWDKLYVHFLQPTFGTYYGSIIRLFVPKTVIAFFIIELFYYNWKYEGKDWQRYKGLEGIPSPMALAKEDEILKKDPEMLNLGLYDPAKYRYFHESFEKRTQLLDVGETQRPW